MSKFFSPHEQGFTLVENICLIMRSHASEVAWAAHPWIHTQYPHLKSPLPSPTLSPFPLSGPASNPVPRLYLGSSPISLSGRLLWAHVGKENSSSYLPFRCLSLHHTGSLGRSDPHSPNPHPSPVSPSSFLGGRNCSSRSLSLQQHLDGDLPNSKGLISA